MSGPRAAVQEDATNMVPLSFRYATCLPVFADSRRFSPLFRRLFRPNFQPLLPVTVLSAGFGLTFGWCGWSDTTGCASAGRATARASGDRMCGLAAGSARLVAAKPGLAFDLLRRKKQIYNQ